jgi:hypothetical protein
LNPAFDEVDALAVCDPVCGELLILGKSVIRYAQAELSAGW